MFANSKALAGLMLLGTLAVVTTGSIRAQSQDDHDAVHQAAMNYLDGIYNVEPDLIRQSVHPTLRKVGYWREDDSQAYRELNMTYDQLVRLAGNWNADGTNAGPDAIKEAEVMEVLDKTAVAKVTAVWGIDYMQLAKIDGRWMIMNIVWQSPPPSM